MIRDVDKFVIISIPIFYFPRWIPHIFIIDKRQKVKSTSKNCLAITRNVAKFNKRQFSNIFTGAKIQVFLFRTSKKKLETKYGKLNMLEDL